MKLQKLKNIWNTFFHPTAKKRSFPNRHTHLHEVKIDPLLIAILPLDLRPTQPLLTWLNERSISTYSVDIIITPENTMEGRLYFDGSIELKTELILTWGI